MEKAELFEKYLRLTKEQALLLENGEIEMLGKNIDEREKVIAAVSALPAAENTPEVEALMREIARIDAENSAALKKLMADTGKESKEMKLRQKGIATYGRIEMPAGPSILDKKS